MGQAVAAFCAVPQAADCTPPSRADDQQIASLGGCADQDPVRVTLHGYWRGRLVLYGCVTSSTTTGALPATRTTGTTRLAYLAAVDPVTGRLAGFRMVPAQARNMQLRRAAAAVTEWLATVLRRISRRFGTRVELRPNRMLMSRQRPDPRQHDAGEAGPNCRRTARYVPAESSTAAPWEFPQGGSAGVAIQQVSAG
jgi:hypothetical protein